MVCETRLRPRQTLAQRAEEVRRATAKLGSGLASGAIKALVSKEGGIAFLGWSEADRDGVTDACALRQIMRNGTIAQKLAIAKAEQLAGRTLDKTKIAAGYHSHTGPGGKLTWHDGH